MAFDVLRETLIRERRRSVVNNHATNSQEQITRIGRTIQGKTPRSEGVMTIITIV